MKLRVSPVVYLEREHMDMTAVGLTELSLEEGGQTDELRRLGTVFNI